MSSFLTETEIQVLKTNQRGRYIQNPTVQQEIEKKKTAYGRYRLKYTTTKRQSTTAYLVPLLGL